MMIWHGKQLASVMVVVVMWLPHSPAQAACTAGERADLAKSGYRKAEIEKMCLASEQAAPAGESKSKEAKPNTCKVNERRMTSKDGITLGYPAYPGQVLPAGDLKIRVNSYDGAGEYELDLKAPGFQQTITLREKTQKTLRICDQDVTISISGKESWPQGNFGSLGISIF